MSGYCKYYKQKKQVSYDNGVSWTDTGDYQKGDLYETNSTDCGYIGTMTRWINSGTTCSGYDKYNLQIKQESYDGGSTWITVSPVETRQGTLIERNSTDCGYVPPTPTPSSGNYLTFVAIDTGTFKFCGDTILDTVSYSIDNGNTWHSLGANGITVSAGNKIMWKGLNADGYFSSTGRFTAEGNIMSIKYGDNFVGQTTITEDSWFRSLFFACSGLISAENLSLPATTLSSYCYSGMFYNCSRLTAAPVLPATTMAECCYAGMFHNCTSLTTAPELPATTLAKKCYNGMFYNCTSLTTVSVLPATTLAIDCYGGMFNSCTSLTTVPSNMLPATTLAEQCYDNMFVFCTSLTTAPELPATTLVFGCYYSMFGSCASLTTAPVLPATTLEPLCYGSMFQDCSSLNSITCLATDISATNCTSNWLLGVSSSGTFTKASGANWGDCGKSKIPCNWTVQTA